jgi:hypothetical protein
MDPRSFDHMIASVAHQRSRRAALRFLAAGLFGGVLAQRGSSFARAAQRADTDGDGLYDDDEVNLYGTDPFNYDTDFDGVGDGEEIYYGTSPLVSDVVVVAEPPPAPVAVDGGTVGDGGCVRFDANGNCVCFALSADGTCAIGVADTYSPPTCRGIGGSCDYDTQCCDVGVVLCCFDGTHLTTRCTDVTAYGGACL